MTPLPEATIKTLAYLDLFDFAPTLLDLERWLLKTDLPHTLSDIQRTLNHDVRIEHVDGFYFLRGRSELVQARKHKYSWTEQKWKRTRRYVRLLAAMPYVDGVWLVNSMGWENARQSSDIDLLIVARPGRIWSARFWTTAVMKLLRQRPHEQVNERAICLSLYVAADALNLQPYRLSAHDIHYTFWVNQCYPLYDRGAYAAFQQQNSWLQEIFDNVQWSQTMERRNIRLSPFANGCKKILQLFCNERLLKKIQWRILPNQLRALANHDQQVVMNDHILKLHTNDTRRQKHTEWEERLRTLEQI
jgi:hypothetical protein